MTRALVLVILGFAQTLALASPALADPAADAKALDASARIHYDLREFAAAIADYKKAFEALHDPLFLFDIGQAYRQLHDCDNARAFYKTYLRERPDADNRAKVEELIERCVPDPPKPLPVQPEPPPRGPLFVPGIATAAAGFVIAGVGTYFAVRAHDKASELETACKITCDGAAVASIDRAGHAAGRDAVIAYAVGGAAMAAGIALIVVSMRHGDEPVVTAAPAAGGATIAATVRF